MNTQVYVRQERKYLGFVLNQKAYCNCKTTFAWKHTFL